MMKENALHLVHDVALKRISFAEACAYHVVKQVEGEILGCCARSCGWSGRSCTLWPFFSPEEKINWEAECCAEISILKDSSRELMCNSVLPGRLAKEASKFDLQEQAQTDVGKVLIGQNASLFWTKKGARESALAKGAQAGAKVTMEFLLEHPKVGEKYLQVGFFRKGPLSESTSLMEAKVQDDMCDFNKFKETCPVEEFMDTYKIACTSSWSVTDKNAFDDILHPSRGDCSLNDPEDVAAAEECESMTTNSGEIVLHYFEYKKENKQKPIACSTLSRPQCKGKVDWLEEIQKKLKSVEELVRSEEIKDYEDLVYVKVKAG